MQLFYFAGFSCAFGTITQPRNLKRLKRKKTPIMLVRNKIMQTANGRHVVYVVVVLALSGKLVDLLQVLR